MDNNTDFDARIINFEGRQFMSVADCAKQYGISKSNVYVMLKEIESLPRYRGAWVRLDKLVNVLVLEDFLHYRTELKEPGMEKRLPPYSATVVRKQRGDLEAIISAADPEVIRAETRQTVEDLLSQAFGR